MKIRIILGYSLSNSLTNITGTVCKALQNIMTTVNLVNILSYEDPCTYLAEKGLLVDQTAVPYIQNAPGKLSLLSQGLPGLSLLPYPSFHVIISLSDKMEATFLDLGQDDRFLH